MPKSWSQRLFIYVVISHCSLVIALCLSAWYMTDQAERLNYANRWQTLLERLADQLDSAPPNASPQDILNSFLLAEELRYAQLVGPGAPPSDRPRLPHAPPHQPDLASTAGDNEVFRLSTELPRSQLRLEVAVETFAFHQHLHAHRLRWIGLSAAAVGGCLLIAVGLRLLQAGYMRHLLQLLGHASRHPTLVDNQASLDPHEAALLAIVIELQQRLEHSHAEIQQASHEAEHYAQVLNSGQQRMNAIMNHLQEGVVCTDANFRIESLNASALTMFGSDQQGVEGVSIISLMQHPQGKAPISPQELRRLQHGQCLLQSHDGPIPMEFSLAPMMDAGRLFYIMSFHDMRPRMDIEHELRQSEALKSAILDSGLNAIITIDQQGTVREFNRAAEKLFGYRRSEALGQPMSELIIPPDLRAQHQAGMARYLSSGEAHVLNRRIEVEAQHHNGSRFPVELAIVPLPMEGETWFTATLQDITERQRNQSMLENARQRAENANQAKSYFLATMSHEIRTPMNAVLGSLTLLQQSPLNDEQKRFAQIAIQSGRALLTIINDILDFSKIEAGKLELEEIPYSLHHLLESVADTLSPRAHAKHLDLALLIHPGLPSQIIGAPDRLRQVLNNLVGNAIKFTDHGGIVIRAEAIQQTGDTARLRLSVHDTGMGIPLPQQEKLFQPFAQLAGHATQHRGGSGLGLAICKQLLHLMHGEIGLQSTEGLGSEFWLELPVRITKPESPSYEARLAGRQVLLGPMPILLRDAISEQLTVLSCDVGQWSEESPLPPADDTLILLDEKAWPSRTPLPSHPGLLLLVDPTQHQSHPAYARIMEKPFYPRRLLDTLEPSELPTAENTAHIACGHGERILLAEDSPVNQVVASTLLNQAGFEVDAVADGREALDAVRRFPYSLVLMDLRMPGMDGLEATRHIRALPNQQGDMPIIALTANVTHDDREACLAAGMNEIISKPIDIERLLESIQRCLAPRNPTAVMAVHSGEMAPALDTATISLDAATLQRLRKVARPERFQHMMSLFLDETQSRLVRIQQAFNDNDWPALELEAHSLKSSGATFGAMQLSQQGRELEQWARSPSAAPAPTTPSQLEQAFAAYKQALEQVLHDNA